MGLRLIGILFCLTASLTAQTPAALPAGVERITTVEGVTEYRLANGLRAVLVPDPSKSTTTVNVTYLAGSRHENYGETGMAHLIEHLVSYGSPKHPDAKKEQQERGARRNASTSVDRTNYYETFPASDANLEWALDLESDRMINAPVRKDILDSQMTVVRNEMEAGENNPIGALAQRVMASIYMWHNYGKSTIGARADVENVPIDRLQAFYKKYYQPDNAVVIIAGKFDEPAAVRLLAQKFGPIPKPARTLDSHLHDGPAAGRRARRDGRARRRRAGPLRGVPRPGGGPSGFGRRRRAGAGAREQPRRPPAQGARREQESRADRRRQPGDA